MTRARDLADSADKDIVGTITVDGLTVAGNVSVDGGTIKLDGNYPVGTSNVALGDAAFDSVTSGSANVAIGASALTANTSGTGNTGIGYNSLITHSTGNFNTAVGNQSLYSNTTASNNTAVGYQAGYSNTTGQYNHYQGYQAGYTNTIGTNNVAMGHVALYYNTGSNNTALGHGALVANLSASYNTAVGNGAAGSNTTGFNNVAIGQTPLYYNTTGSYNIAIGPNSLFNNTTGSSNTALGNDALISNTTASDNTAVGGNTLINNLTGNNNTAVGRYAGEFATGASNTFIGRSAGFAITSGEKNTILGRYNGNAYGLDIRTSSNNIVLSDGDGNPRVCVTDGGYAKFRAENSSYVNLGGNYHEFNHDDAGSTAFVISQESSAFVNTSLYIKNARSNSSNYSFFLASSGGGSDNEFKLKGDGNAYADGSWNGGGADYAEYFEWHDGNTANEDRRGFSVVLVNNKLRKATADDDAGSIIGVVSGNPSVVGDTDMDAWKHKYLRDDYGTYQRDENDERILNPDYNPDQEYTSRQNRPEWDTVGLMGKLRIRKGQPTGSNWIKMRDVSDTVEEWLVR